MRFIFIFLTLFSKTLFAVEIYGTVSDKNGEPLPFANIYVKATSTGCATNEDGFYTFYIEKGTYTIIFQYLGFRKQEIEVVADKERIELNIQLEEESTLLDSVVISSNEDPAYRIIREAIANREKHLKEINAFSCDVYIKILQKITDAPDAILGVELKTIFDLDTNNTGVVYLSESSSKFHYQYPNKTKEFMYASKRSGDNSQFSWNDAASIQFNIYENAVDLNGITERNFVSPIANNAFFFYEYELLGSFSENNIIIYKIKVSPKRKTDPVFTGNLYITGNDYRIYSNQLTITKQNGIDFVDTLTVKQEFVPLENNKWALLSNQFTFSYSFFGIKGAGYINAFYKDYILEPVFEKNFFNAEISSIQEKANEKDNIYWDSIRPVQLTALEKIDYKEKDSLYIMKNTDAYKDSVDRGFNKFEIGDLITGYTYRNSKKDVFFSTSGIADLLEFNTVEGYVVKPSLRIFKKWENEKQLTVIPTFQYGFASKKFATNASLKYEYNPIKFASFEIEGGNDIVQFNEDGIRPLANTVSTLLFERNLLKLYQKNFISLKHSIEVFNGFYFTAYTECANREQLRNAEKIDPYINYDTRTFTSNNYPFADDKEALNMRDKFTIGGTFKYVIAQKYATIPEKKYIAQANYPTLQLTYEKAIPEFFRNLVRYDYVEFKIEDRIKLNLVGNLEYVAITGNYFNEQNMSIADIKHFEGNETLVPKSNNTSFFNLPYYTFSTTEPFIETHVSYHTEGFLFNKLPLFKQLKLQPVFTFSALLTDSALGNYYEFTAGIEHIFKIARVDFSYTPYDFSTIYPQADNFRITVGIGF